MNLRADRHLQPQHSRPGHSRADRYLTQRYQVFKLLRLDRAFDKIWGSWIVAASFGIGLRFFAQRYENFAYTPASQQAPAFGIIFITLMLLFNFILISTNINSRCSRISLVIPVEAKRLWMTRMISVVTASILPVIIISLIMAFRSRSDGIYLETAVLSLGLKCVSAVIFAAMLFQSWKIELHRIPVTPGYMTFLILGGLAVSGATFIGITWPFTAPVFLVIALLLGIRIYRQIPGAFRTAPRIPERPTASYSNSGATSSRSGNGTPMSHTSNGSAVALPKSSFDSSMTVSSAGATRLGRSDLPGRFGLRTYTVLGRGLLHNWKVWIYSILIVFYTFMIMLTYADGASKDNPYSIFLYTWIWMVIIEVLARMYKFEHLPISRKKIFAFAWGIVIFAICVGIGVGSTLTSLNSRKFRQLRFYKNELHIPHEFLEISSEGPPAPVLSPWGETHQPESYPLFKGSDIHIYNPYEWGEESSSRFIALQIDRVMEAVHGKPYDRQSMYEDIDDDLEKTIESCCYSITEGDNSSEARARAFVVASTIAAAIYCLIFSFSLRAFRVGRFKTLMAWVFPGSLILIVLIVAGVLIAAMMDATTTHAVRALPAIWMRIIAEAIPLGLKGLWAMLAVVFVMGTMLVYSTFRKTEAISSFGKAFLKDY